MIEEIKNDNPKLEIEKIKMSADVENKKIVEPLPNYGFFMCMVAPPKSGKTNLIMNLINKKGKFYYKKFHRVYIWSPSINTIDEEINLAPEKIKQELDIDELSIILLDLKNEAIKTKNKIKTLFVFDDVISSIKKNVDEFKKMILNRRHYGPISIILTSQKWNLIPLELRSNISHLVLFNPNNKKEIINLYEEIIHLDKDDFYKILNFVFDKKFNFMFIDIYNKKIYKNFNLLIING